MGVRFRKSVKICKGVKVNFSKSGASLSLGGRGHRVNFGKRGTRVTYGIPGTGLSYSTKIGGSSHKTTKHHKSNRKTPIKQIPGIPLQLEIHMNEVGQVTIVDGNGKEITDPALVRRIKQTPQYLLQKQQLDEQRSAMIDEIVQQSEEENERFINIYKLSSLVDSKEDFERRLLELKPDTFVAEQFNIPMPSEVMVREQLTQEAKENVNGSIFTVSKLRKQYVNDNIQDRLSSAIANWENERAYFYQLQEQKRIETEAVYKEEYDNQRLFLQNLINGEEDEISEVFDSWIASCELPVEICINYDWNKDDRVMMLDVDLPEIEDLSEVKKIKTDSGNLKEKKKTQAELRGEYATLVLGLAMFISSNAFNVSPAIEKLLVSGYTQRRNKDGDINDDYIYSIKFKREMFEKINITEMNPKTFCMNSENRCNMTTTSLFKVIKPYDSF